MKFEGVGWRDCQVVPGKHGLLRFRMILGCHRALSGAVGCLQSSWPWKRDATVSEDYVLLMKMMLLYLSCIDKQIAGRASRRSSVLRILRHTVYIMAWWVTGILASVCYYTGVCGRVVCWSLRVIWLLRNNAPRFTHWCPPTARYYSRYNSSSSRWQYGGASIAITFSRLVRSHPRDPHAGALWEAT